MAGLRIDQLATNLIGPVSLDIAGGECLALMGPSGAGESLLLRAIVDLDPNTGNIVNKRVPLCPQANGENASRLFLLNPDGGQIVFVMRSVGIE